MTKKIKIIYEFEPFVPDPKNYDGEPDIEKMAQIKVKQLEDGDVDLSDFIAFFEGKIKIKYKIVDE